MATASAGSVLIPRALATTRRLLDFACSLLEQLSTTTEARPELKSGSRPHLRVAGRCYEGGVHGHGPSHGDDHAGAATFGGGVAAGIEGEAGANSADTSDVHIHLDIDIDINALNMHIEAAYALLDGQVGRLGLSKNATTDGHDYSLENDGVRLDAVGIKLWNTCTRLLRAGGELSLKQVQDPQRTQENPRRPSPGLKHHHLSNPIQHHNENLDRRCGDGCPDIGGESRRLIADKNERRDSGRWRKMVDVLYRARVLAFLLLECGAAVTAVCDWGKERGAVATEEDVRLMKVALRTVQGCLEYGQLDVALKALECAAAHEEKLATVTENDYSSRHHETSEKEVEGDYHVISRKLTADYYILRTALSWRQHRLDMSEHMFGKIPHACLRHELAVATRTADLAYEIGAAMLMENDFPVAVTWLERALDVLEMSVGERGEGREPVRLNIDAGELRLAVLHALVRANLALPQGLAEAKAAEYMGVLEKDYGHRLPVVMLNLELIVKESEPDYARYHEILCEIGRTLPFTESNFRLLVRHLYRLKDYRLDLAVSALRQLIFERLVFSADTVLLEKGFITYIWMQTSDPGLTSGLVDLEHMATQLIQVLGAPMSKEPTYASLILLWKKVGYAFEQKEYRISENWCKLARHPIFENAGEVNQSKLQRKLISCALAANDVASASRYFYESSDACKYNPLTRYLTHSVALLDGNDELAEECVEVLCTSGPDAIIYLQACVSEARRFGNQRRAAAVLQRLVQRIEVQHLEGLQIPTLLRCTARLLVAETAPETSEASKREQRQIIDQLCGIFESAARLASDSLDSPNLFSVTELEWFSRNSYNIAVQNCAIWEPSYVWRLLDACIQLTNLYPPGLGVDATADIEFRKLNCHFLGAVICTAQARSCDAGPVAVNNPTSTTHDGSLPLTQLSHSQPLSTSIKASNHHYAASRTHVQHFRALVQQRAHTHGPDELVIWQHKYATLLAFDFEAGVRLEHWGGLARIVDEARHFLAEAMVGEWEGGLVGVFADALLCGVDRNESRDSGIVEEIANVFKHLITTLINLQIRDRDRVHRQSSISRSCASPPFHSPPYLSSCSTLARRLRCLFQLARNAANDSIAEQVLADALALARLVNSASANPNTTYENRNHNHNFHCHGPDENDNPIISDLPGVYPSAELEWLATTAFNRAVDHYLAADDTACARWAGAALGLADAMAMDRDGGDGGMLRRVLRGKLMALEVEVEGVWLESGTGTRLGSGDTHG